MYFIQNILSFNRIIKISISCTIINNFFLGEIYLDFRPSVRFQGLRACRSATRPGQRMVLDGRAAEAGPSHPERSERLVPLGRHRQTSTRQPRGATRRSTWELPRRSQSVLQWWSQLARRGLSPRQTLGLRGEWGSLEICSLHKSYVGDLSF